MEGEVNNDMVGSKTDDSVGSTTDEVGNKSDKPLPSSTVSGAVETNHRTSSPGMAKRVTSDSSHAEASVVEDIGGSNSKLANENVIDDMSQRLADSLLVKPTASASKSEYISMNKKLEIQKQKELAAQSAVTQNERRAAGDIPSVHVSSSYSSLNNDAISGNEGIASSQDTDANSHVTSFPSNDVTSTLPLRSNNSTHLDMDIGTLSMNKVTSAAGGSAPPSTQTLFNHTPNGGITDVNTSLPASQEVDILTAMSGEPMPNSLPLVADGLSDGEISSDSEVDNGDSADLADLVHTCKQDRVSSQHTDPFFLQHESIMKSKTAEQVAQVKATVESIRSAVAKCPPSKVDQLNIFETKDDSNPTTESPIWEIRESYAEALREQEQKRKQRMELEKRYEAEYRQKQMQEIEMLEAEDNKILAAQILDDDNIEQMNVGTDYYSSDDDETMNYGEADGSREWGWSSSSKYSRVGNADGYRRSSVPSTVGHSQCSSNASRLAAHQMVTSPRASQRFGRRSRFSQSSDSSSSSPTPPTAGRCKAHDLQSPGSNSDSSSTHSWDQDYRRVDSPSHLSPNSKKKREQGDYDTDEETDRLLNKPYQEGGRVDLPPETQELGNQAMKNKAKEVTVYDPDEPTVLIEGILFRAAYLGSTQLMSEAQPSKAIRMLQAQEAVGRIKAGDGENQPSTDVDLFVSTEKVMVLNTGLQEIMMDHALRSISYIADIDNILVIMAKRSLVVGPSTSSSGDETASLPSTTQQKLICHIFETDEAHLIAQSIGQAFQVAYMEFLKANGIDDPNLHIKDTSYEDILEQQEIMHDELETFTRKDKQKDVIVPKTKGEALGIVIVESGWGSMLPTVILANMSPVGAAARCGHLNIGDQIISVNGISLVGLPLSTCQEHVKAVKNLTAVRLCVVSRPPVVEVLIKRPDKKYQLGFSVQNGVICSLLRGGIAERGGIRVGHRIIEINGQSVVAVAHEKIVHMLSTSVGEIHMKTMPMAVFRLLTGQEIPQYI